MIICAKNHRLGDRRPDSPAGYAGLFCIYCGEPVADLKAEEGQIVLESRNPQRRRYVAVVHRDKQRIASDVQIGALDANLLLDGRENVSLRTYKLLLAFQDTEEKLEL